jgi:formate C-acetyltransferase
VDREIESLPTRPQDPFQVRPEDIEAFKSEIFPFWQGKTLEDVLDERIGGEMRASARLPRSTRPTTRRGISARHRALAAIRPSGLLKQARQAQKQHPENHDFYEGLAIALEGASQFMLRYARWRALWRALPNRAPNCWKLRGLRKARV